MSHEVGPLYRPLTWIISFPRFLDPSPPEGRVDREARKAFLENYYWQ